MNNIHVCKKLLKGIGKKVMNNFSRNIIKNIFRAVVWAVHGEAESHIETKVDENNIGERVIFDITIGMPNTISEDAKADFRSRGDNIIESLTELSSGLTYNWCSGTWDDSLTRTIDDLDKGSDTSFEVDICLNINVSIMPLGVDLFRKDIQRVISEGFKGSGLPVKHIQVLCFSATANHFIINTSESNTEDFKNKQ